VVFTFGTSSSDDASDKDKEDSVANVATDVDFLNTAGDDSAAATLLLLTTGIIELYLLLLLLRTIMAIHRVLTRGGVGSAVPYLDVRRCQKNDDEVWGQKWGKFLAKIFDFFLFIFIFPHFFFRKRENDYVHLLFGN
jgi:hypothetical protein